MDSSPETVFQILFQWNLDYGFQSLVGFRIPQGAVYSGIQCPGFRIPPVKIPVIPESGFPYMGREIAKLHLRSFLSLLSFRFLFRGVSVFLLAGPRPKLAGKIVQEPIQIAGLRRNNILY